MLTPLKKSQAAQQKIDDKISALLNMGNATDINLTGELQKKSNEN